MIAIQVLHANGTDAWLGQFGNIASARQAILDHARLTDLPTEEPWHAPDIGVLEGWFVGRTEYLIRHSRYWTMLSNQGIRT